MKQLKIFWMFVAIILASAGCDKNEETVTDLLFDLGENFEVQFDQNAVLSQGAFQVKVIEVLEDSRCAVGAICVWEGRVKLRLEIYNNSVGVVEEIIFQSGKDEFITNDGYQIRLVKVTPDQQIDEVIDLEDYEFTFVVTEI